MTNSKINSLDIELKGTKRITIGALTNYINIILGILNGFFVIPLISQKLGTGSYGLFVLSNSLISLLLIDFGLSTTTNTFISRMRAENKEDEIGPFIGTIIKIYFLIDCFIFLIELFFFLFLNQIYQGITDSQLPTLRVLFIISAIFSLISFPSTPLIGVLNAYEKFAWNTLAEIIQKFIYIVLCIVILFIFPNIIFITFISCFSGLVSIALRLILIKKTRIQISFKKQVHAKGYLKEILSFTIWAAVISIFWRLFKFLGPTILGIVSNAEQISVFSISSEIETYAFMLCGAISGFFLPKITRALTIKDENKKIERIQNLAITVAKIISTLFLLITAGFAVYGKEFIMLWMKEPLYAKSYLPAILIMLGEAMVFPNIVLRNTLYASGYIKKLAIVQILSGIIFVLFGFLLSSFLGALGLALGILLSQFTLFISTNYLYKKYLKIKLNKYYINSYNVIFLPILALIAFSVGLKKIFILNNWVSLILAIIFSTLIYSFMIITLHYNDEELKNFYKIIKR